MAQNQAFVFIKPHANTPKFQAVVKQTLADFGVNINESGSITGEQIDKHKYIDQHYYAIASKATLMQPHELNVPVDKFQKKFGETWKDVLAAGRAFNASGYATHRKWDAATLDKENFAQKKKGLTEKFGGGFYCTQFDNKGKKEYCFNGFFMSMRSKFTAPGTSINYFVVTFDPDKLSWEDFRGKVLGPTDPATAPAGSLRRLVFDNWQAYGLKAEPNTGDNGMHASASPFEGLAELNNWLKKSWSSVSFGKTLLGAGFSESTLNEWSVDPQIWVSCDKKGSMFDQVEDMDADECLKKCGALLKLQKDEVRDQAKTFLGVVKAVSIATFFGLIYSL